MFWFAFSLSIRLHTKQTHTCTNCTFAEIGRFAVKQLQWKLKDFRSLFCFFSFSVRQFHFSFILPTLRCTSYRWLFGWSLNSHLLGFSTHITKREKDRNGNSLKWQGNFNMTGARRNGRKNSENKLCSLAEKPFGVGLVEIANKKGANAAANEEKTTLNNWSQLNSTWCDCALCMLRSTCAHTHTHEHTCSPNCFFIENGIVLCLDFVPSFSIISLLVLCFWLIGSTTANRSRIPLKTRIQHLLRFPHSVVHPINKFSPKIDTKCFLFAFCNFQIAFATHLRWDKRVRKS